ncbi:hypothetical protein CHH28_05250 [Bacterioplanes sanyensis]|uniref:Uncharacterized protein n=1 Tax=Bacterioplanes sanyensis TaxID=1249553 RepID=A0A222FHR6_9GAMM|nr:hypothetical protein CHH28_05250 [Bacterioplanes sanyensis]
MQRAGAFVQSNSLVPVEQIDSRQATRTMPDIDLTPTIGSTASPHWARVIHFFAVVAQQPTSTGE